MVGRAPRPALLVAAPLGAAWLLHRRRTYRRSAQPLAADQHARLAPWCSPTLLAAVRVAYVPRIRPPVPPHLAPRGMLDLSTVRAMAFIDTIVVANDNQHPADDHSSLLFHEIVHLAQFRLLGVHGFVRAYLRGWLDAGRSYLDNPLETMAFDLQHRFDNTEQFDLMREVAAALGVEHRSEC